MRIIPASLFGRMAALALLLTVAALAVAGVAIGGVLERFVTSTLDARLADRLGALASAVRVDGSIDAVQLARVTVRARPGEGWRIDTPRAAAGAAALAHVRERRRHRAPLPPGRDRPPPPAAGDVRPFDARPFDASLVDGTRVHGLSMPVATAAGPARVRVAVPRREIDRPVLAMLAPLAASLAILGLALGTAALLQLRLGLRPLRRLRGEVEAIRRGDATHVGTDLPDELAPLARELNALVADNAAALGGARASAANLAHALKTPVATLSLHLAGDPAARAQLARIEGTLRHHLTRARGTVVGRGAATPLAPALADLTDAVARLHAGRIAIALDVAGDLAVAVDPHDLDEIVGNLLDNATRHAAAHVALTVRAEGRMAAIAVRDDGPGIPADSRSRATAPGVRLDERGEGHGFGLAIVRELAELYGGTLSLGEAPGGGLLAHVTLPRSPADRSPGHAG